MDNRYNLYNFEADFRSYLLAGNVSTSTLKNYLSDYRHFCGWTQQYTKQHQLEHENNTNSRNLAFNLVSISVITVETIIAYKTYLINSDLPIKTVNRRLSTVRKFCSFCISQGWMTNNPAKQVQNSKMHHVGVETSESEPTRLKRNEVTGEPRRLSKKEHEALSQFSHDLSKQGVDNQIITNYLNDVQEFLSVK